MPVPIAITIIFNYLPLQPSLFAPWVTESSLVFVVPTPPTSASATTTPPAVSIEQLTRQQPFLLLPPLPIAFALTCFSITSTCHLVNCVTAISVQASSNLFSASW